MSDSVKSAVDRLAQGAARLKTGLVYSDKMLLHDTGPGHPERPARLEAILQALASAGLDPPRIPIVPATRADLLRVHTEEHVDTVQYVCAHAGEYPDPDTPMGPASWEAALLAAGGVISACRAVLEGAVDNVFCAVRPPGHHAEAGRAMGFCLFNNVAIAARWLQREAGLKRIGIFDWDVHHGNGTQQAFYDDAGVCFISIHQHPLYPGTGWPSERGRANNIHNIQMASGADPDEWVQAVDEAVVPWLKQFDPEFLLLSAGFDTHHLDPLGGQLLEARHYALMTRRVRALAGGRVVSVLEGGYHLQALQESVLAHFGALQGAA